MNNVYMMRRTPKVAKPADLSAVIVAGSGGAGTTTTVYGLATALALGTGRSVSAVDATTDGGNLLRRAGATTISSAIRNHDSRRSSAGVTVIGTAGDHAVDPAIVDELLAGRDSARIHDVGTALRSRRLSPLLKSGVALVVVSPARAEPLHRMRDALDWLTQAYGREVLADTVVVVSHQSPSSPVDLDPIRAALSPLVAGFVEVAYDPALARPGVLEHEHLAPATLDSWMDALDAIGSLIPSTDTQSDSEELA